MEFGLKHKNYNRKQNLRNNERVNRYSCETLTKDEDLEAVFKIDQTSLFSLPE
jgi:hypothetical protein